MGSSCLKLCSYLPSWVSTCVVGMTVAVGVGVGTVAGVIIGLMLARGVGLFPGLTGCLLAVATTGVGLMLAVGGSDVLALNRDKDQDMNNDFNNVYLKGNDWFIVVPSSVNIQTISGFNGCVSYLLLSAAGVVFRLICLCSVLLCCSWV